MNFDTEIGIVEMGANHAKEIKLLCDIAKPNVGYITNFGKAHLEAPMLKLRHSNFQFGTPTWKHLFLFFTPTLKVSVRNAQVETPILKRPV